MSTETSEASPRRRWVWVCVGLGVLLLLALTPPWLNVNRLQRRIARSMSASLGRPVTLDRVTVHLLPVPGFTLENLVVGEDPAFGAEPVIRANTVEVRLRPSSLWRRQVEFSSIKFVEGTSLNLVRNARGEWNVQSLLMHAANVETAPTAQRRAGPEPRFPYIEATGARVNLKLGEEKKPFSLTETDFALWLPTAQQWQVRMEGKPARTDTNISDPGTVKLEGSLERAGSMAEVPVDLTASWEDVPLGELSKIVSGADAGWRGNMVLSARLTGKLSAAKLTTRVHLEELRRTDFVPVEMMDFHVDCDGTLDVPTAVVSDADCSVGAPAPEGSKVAGRVVALADSVDLQALSTSGLHVGMTNVSDAWLLDWARLFSQRIPASEHPKGTMAGSVAFTTARKGAQASWQGEIHGDVEGVLPWETAESGFVLHPVSITSTASKSGDAGFVLTPFSFTPPGKTPALTLSGTANRAGYTLRLVGTATAEQVLALRAKLPPLGDGLQEALPELGDTTATKVVKIDVTCSRAWGAAQTCGAGAVEPVKRRHGRR